MAMCPAPGVGLRTRLAPGAYASASLSAPTMIITGMWSCCKVWAAWERGVVGGRTGCCYHLSV